MSKKSFKNNPALQFVSSRADVAEEKLVEGAASVNNQMPNIINFTPETKSKRFNMLLRPSVFGLLQKSAKEKNISVNELINSLIDIYIQNKHQN